MLPNLHQWRPYEEEGWISEEMSWVEERSSHQWLVVICRQYLYKSKANKVTSIKSDADLCDYYWWDTRLIKMFMILHYWWQMFHVTSWMTMTIEFEQSVDAHSRLKSHEAILMEQVYILPYCLSCIIGDLKCFCINSNIKLMFFCLPHRYCWQTKRGTWNYLFSNMLIVIYIIIW